jgi:ATP-dependent DNA helicase RecQ
MTRTEAEKILEKVFKLESFYDTQWNVIEKIFKGERVLLIEKTGYGKSLCFQFPATQFDGTTIIFSPLIALMRDQVNKLKQLGINAKCINSNQSLEENNQIIKDAKENKIKILYIAPERMENAEWLQTASQMRISMLVVDEAHCISMWGHDFRPSYRRIINLVRLLPSNFPILATTATATPKVEEDIKVQIGNVISVRGNLIRNNFHLNVIKVNSEDEKFIWLGRNLNRFEGTGIIYAGTRINAEIISNWLNFSGISSTFYHGDLDGTTRKSIEKGLIENRWKCVVSTNALGMGIDKPDIRFIIHTQIPESPIHYYQEIGRAGRDDKKTYIILFYNPDDTSLPLAFIDGSKPSLEKYDKVINLIKQKIMDEQDLMISANLTSTQVRVILADLIDQGIINESFIRGKKKFEYRFRSPKLKSKLFDELREAKLKELDMMVEYIDTTKCRMKFLCDYLGDNFTDDCGKCDVDLDKKIQKVIIKEEWTNKLADFRNNYYPILDVKTKNNNLNNGIAASYYGFSNVGSIIHRCKYEGGGDFPDELVQLTLNAFNKHLSEFKFDLILYVPPTESGDLVKNFAIKISEALKIPISHGLVKCIRTEPQKIFQNYLSKVRNVSESFVYVNVSNIKNKSILLLDDIYDSGATIKEIGRYLTGLGAKLIAPLVIAKTVGGNIK